MGQMVRLVKAADDGVLVGHRALICDRDRKWSRAVRQQLGEAGIRVILTPERAPNANAYAERFVRSIKEECLDRMIPVGEPHFRRAVAEFVAHQHREQNHQGLNNQLITASALAVGRIAELLRACGVISGPAEMWNRTGERKLPEIADRDFTSATR
jgi:hypothetical protein